ncbi:MAG TPA: carbonic anhydrase [Verrucomicrobiae bacterium]|nr:carbonic anhydrase [Verrucomicrobiae bacterium]
MRANVLNAVNQLRGAGPILAALVKSGKLRVVGGCYDLETGRVWIVE